MKRNSERATKNIQNYKKFQLPKTGIPTKVSRFFGISICDCFVDHRRHSLNTGLMDESSSSDSTLAWLWLLEYLASVPEIDPSILRDLINAAPDLPDDMSENTREMVALRCLEYLFDRNNDVPSVGPKVFFDLSESCEDVLHSILKEASVSDLKKAGPELWKWDLDPFIMHKRASLPKCALEKEKDEVLQGTHIYAALLKESSEQVNANYRRGQISADSADLNPFSGRIDASGVDRQMMAAEGDFINRPLVNENGVVEIDSLNRNLSSFKRTRSNFASENLAVAHEDQGCVDGSNVLSSNAKRLKQDPLCANQSVEQISTTPQGKDLVGDTLMVEDSYERMVVSAKNRDPHMEKESSLGGLEESMSLENGHDECVAIKRLGQSPDAGANNELQHAHSEIAHNADKMPQAAPGDVLDQYILVDGVNDAEPKTSNAAPSVGTPDKAFVDEDKGHCDHVEQPKPSNVASINGFHRNSDDETEGHMDHLSEDDNLKENDEYEHEKVDIALEKSQLLSSQCELSDDPLTAANWSELNLCVKCGKDGSLLVCSAGGCPLVVHENCLGFSAKFNEKGEFYCPFCAYSLSISCYLEAKKKACLARGELKAFIQMGFKYNSDEHTQRVHKAGQYNSDEHTQRVHKARQHSSSQYRDMDQPHKFQDDENLVERECDKANDRGQLVKVHDLQFQKRKEKDKQAEPLTSLIGVDSLGREGSDVNGRTNRIVEGEKEGEEFVEEQPSINGIDRGQNQIYADPQYTDGVVLFKDKESNVNGRTNHVSDGEKDGEEMVEEQPSVSGTDRRQDEICVDPLDTDDNLLFKDKELDVNGRTNHISDGEKEGEEMVEEQQASSGPDRCQDRICVDPQDSDDTVLCKDKEKVSGSHSRDASLDKTTCGTDIDGEEISDDEDDKPTSSKYYIRIRRRERQYTYPALPPQVRRKKVQWTAQEEEMLKEGMQKFSSVHDKRIPWKKILEHGSSVFLPGRTAIDLKDKWRNLNGSPKKPN